MSIGVKENSANYFLIFWYRFDLILISAIINTYKNIVINYIIVIVFYDDNYITNQ
jgi:hypothetical protein